MNRKATSRWLYWAVLMGIACQSIIALESAEGGAGRNYLAIVKRNAFQLSDTPPPKKEEAPPPPPPKDVELKFTGIYRRHGIMKACLAIIDSSEKPPKTTYLQLAKGEKQDRIEVTSIDIDAGLVEVLNGGSPTELSFKQSGYKTAVAKAPKKTTSKTSSRSSGSRTTSSRSSSPSRSSTSGSRSSGSSQRSSRTSGSSGRSTGSSSRGYSSRGPISQGNSARMIPGQVRRQNRIPESLANQPNQDPVTQAARMLVEKAAFESKGVIMPPLPPEVHLNSEEPNQNVDPTRGGPPMLPGVMPGGPFPPPPTSIGVMPGGPFPPPPPPGG